MSDAVPARATHEPSPEGLGHSVGIAIADAVASLTAWAEGRMINSRAEWLYWKDMKAELPARLNNALHDRGLAVSKMGARFETSVSISSEEQPYQRTARLKLALEPSIIEASVRFPDCHAADPDYLHQYLPRLLASNAAGALRDRATDEIAAAIAMEARQGGDACGSVHDSATPKGDRPHTV